MLLETRANNGLYLDLHAREYVPRPRRQSLWVQDLPREQIRYFGDTRALAILRQLEEPEGADTAGARVPLLDAYARTLPARAGLRRVGSCCPTSSLRTVIPAPELKMQGWALKLHLPDALRPRRRRHMASKAIAAIDAMVGPVFSSVLQRVQPLVSPFLGVIEEPCGMVASLDPEGSTTAGAILRRLPDGALIPGFSIYSRPRRPLQGSSPFGARWLASALARPVDGSAPRLDRIDRCLALFVDPLLDIFFSLASQGITVQMHAQNILFEMDVAGAETRRIWVRDMAGVSYAAEFRRRRGLDDLLAAVLDAVPGASSDLMRQWLERDGQRRRLFDERFMFGHSYDVHLSAFWYQLLVGFWRAKVLRFREIALLTAAIRAHAQAAAAHYGFDTALLLPRYPAQQGWFGALVRGIARHPPFRPFAAGDSEP